MACVAGVTYDELTKGRAERGIARIRVRLFICNHSGIILEGSPL